jgi:hypothetical protein
MSSSQLSTVVEFRRSEIDCLIAGIDAALTTEMESRLKHSLLGIREVLKETVKSKTKPRPHRAPEKLRCPMCHTIAVEGRCPAAACPANELKDIRDSPGAIKSSSRKRSRSPRVESTGCDESPPPKNGDDDAKPAVVADTLQPPLEASTPALPPSNGKLRMITSFDAHRAELRAHSVSDCHGIVTRPTIGMKCYHCIGVDSFVPAEIVEVKDRGHVTVRLCGNLGIKTRSSFLRADRSTPKVATTIQPETVATETIMFSTEM